MPRKIMWVEWDDGSDLSQSRKKPGNLSPLTREEGTDKLGQVTLSPVDDDENDCRTDSPTDFANVTDGNPPNSRTEEISTADKLLEALRLLGIIIEVGEKAAPFVIKAGEKAAPIVKGWWNDKKSLWNDKALPARKSAWSRVVRTRDADSQPVTGESSALIEEQPDSSQQLVATLEESKASMSSAEAQKRFVAALVARLFSEDQLSVLRNARIEDEQGPSELAVASETLTAQQIGESITLTLEANPSLLGGETLAELGKILGGSRAEGEYVPERSEEIKKTPRPDNGEE